MDELLRPASIVRTTKDDAEPGFTLELSKSTGEQISTGESRPKFQHKAPTTPDDALETLKTEPDYDSLISVLAFLSHHEAPDSAIPSIKQPSPLSAQLVQVLVSEIVPNYWALLIEDSHQPKTSGLKLLLYCLSSTTGVNAILVRLKALTGEAKSEAAAKARRPDIALGLGILLDLLCRLLQGDAWILEAFRLATSGLDGPARVRPRLQEIVAAFGGGRIVSLAAEAEEVARSDASSSKPVGDIWPADSLQYTQWLGRNIAKLASDPSNIEAKSTSELFAKALRLGHPGEIYLILYHRPD